MRKRVLDVGQCPPDHSTLRAYLTDHFDVEVVQAHEATDALDALRGGHFDLVLINRKLDRDDSNGIEVLRAIKSDPHVAAVPVMLVTNYADHQDAAVAAGAERGFGKLEFDKPETTERLRKFLA